MKEQVITSRAPRRGNAQGKGVAQRPVRRDGRRVERARFSVRSLYGYVPAALKVVVVILGVIGLAIGYRAASSASLFQVRAIDVHGTARTSREEIETLVRRNVARTGVWRADLTSLSAELGRLPGVRRAVVTRVLPDRLRVRITERMPSAVMRTSTGHFVWVDDEGVTLGEMKTNDQMPPFFIRGWNEDGTNEARHENAERVKKYQEALRDWQAAGLVDRVSEISLFDLHDIRAQLAGKDSQIEVRLGDRDLGSRLKAVLEKLDEYRQTPRGALIIYAAYQGNNVLLGYSSGDRIAAGADNSGANAPSAESAQNSSAAAAASSETARRADRSAPVRKVTAKPAPTPRSKRGANTNRNG